MRVPDSNFYLFSIDAALGLYHREFKSLCNRQARVAVYGHSPAHRKTALQQALQLGVGVAPTAYSLALLAAPTAPPSNAPHVCAQALRQLSAGRFGGLGLARQPVGALTSVQVFEPDRVVRMVLRRYGFSRFMPEAADENELRAHYA